DYWNDVKNDHNNTCKAGNSVVVKILDACPGIHKINEDKGKQNWCNDTSVDHFDLYRPAFDHIAQIGDGVIKMNYKRTDCSRVGYWYLDQDGKPQKHDKMPVTNSLPISV
ncbi:RlpA-like double-psi beta-barrel-protein domain-containing protein-containing protein, partial [Paraphysoderma sedebokerense]